MNAELARIEPMPQSPTVEAMITLAIEKGASVDTIERLMAVRREVRAEQAKEAFDRALAAFQAECPTIQKTAKVMNKDGRSVRYQYAPLDAIIHQVKGLLQKHGFSYSVNAKSEPKSVQAVCKLTHAYGHSETSEFAVPIDTDAYMNPAQQVASALTFAKRYAFCNACGIMTGDQDDDSQASHEARAASAAPTAKAKPPQKPAEAPQKATASAILPGEPTLEQKNRWIALLSPLGDWAKNYAIENGWIMPNEELADMNLSWKCIPKTKGAADKILAELRARVDAAASASASSNGSANPEDQPWFDAVVPVPHAGQKRDEYLKNPDTIGSLYNARHDDEHARRRLFGFIHNYEPKGWQKRDGTQMPPSESDKKFRADLDAFYEWFEQNHADECVGD